jgi:hypothetical protein
MLRTLSLIYAVYVGIFIGENDLGILTLFLLGGSISVFDFIMQGIDKNHPKES